ncbi:MAG: cysteine desulfurase [Planctomycetales bacterium]|nr:cysteine desulfurase [Planctomycetales bacterium]
MSRPFCLRSMDYLYLDHSATTPLAPEVLHRMLAAQADFWANPASLHEPGQRSRRALDEIRRSIGKLLGAEMDRRGADRVVLTSGGTEANNLAIRGLAGSPPGRIILSSIEHPSISALATSLARAGFDVVGLPVNAHGVCDVEQFESLLADDTQLVSVMLVNNETGVIQPVAALAARCRARGILMHTDAVQAVGKLPVDFAALGTASLTVSAHKLHGPVGVGALLVRGDVALKPQLFGGTQQGSLRPGTESVPLATGLLAALQHCLVNITERIDQLRLVRDQFEAQLNECGKVVINGQSSPRAPHITNVAFAGLDRQMLQLRLDRLGVACSTGSACASGSSEPSPVLLAMGCSREIVESSLRFSFGATTTAAEAAEAARRIASAVAHLTEEKG